MNTKIITLLSCLVLIYVGGALAQEPLCPAPKPVPEGADELMMLEGDFTQRQYLDSLDFLQNEFPRRLLAFGQVSEFEHNTEFWISYYNSLKFIEGYVLRQAARAEVSAQGTKGEATDRFCQFLQKARYED